MHISRSPDCLSENDLKFKVVVHSQPDTNFAQQIHIFLQFVAHLPLDACVWCRNDFGMTIHIEPLELSTGKCSATKKNLNRELTRKVWSDFRAKERIRNSYA